MPPKKKNRCAAGAQSLLDEHHHRVAYGVPSTEWGALYEKWQNMDSSEYTEDHIAEALSRGLSFEHPLLLLKLDVLVMSWFGNNDLQRIVDAGCVPMLLGFIKGYVEKGCDVIEDSEEEKRKDVNNLDNTLLKGVMYLILDLVISPRHKKIVFDEGGVEILSNLAAGTFDSIIFGLACEAVFFLAYWSAEVREALKKTVLPAVLPFRYATLRPSERMSTAVSLPVARLVWQISLSCRNDQAILRRLIPIINEHLEHWCEGVGFAFRSCAVLLAYWPTEDASSCFPKLGTCLVEALGGDFVEDQDLVDALRATALIARSPFSEKIIEWKLLQYLPSLFTRQYFRDVELKNDCCFAVLRCFLRSNNTALSSTELVDHLLSFERTVYPHLINFCTCGRPNEVEESLNLLRFSMRQGDQNAREYLVAIGILDAVAAGLNFEVEGNPEQQGEIRRLSRKLLSDFITYAAKDDDDEIDATSLRACVSFLLDNHPMLTSELVARPTTSRRSLVNSVVLFAFRGGRKHSS